MLFEREQHLARLQRAVAFAGAGTGSVVLIEGPAGIGKTALLLAARRLAQQGGMRSLRARCSELEQEFAFGVVRQLLEAVLARADEAERSALLSGAAALAGPLFDLASPAGGGHADDPAGSAETGVAAGPASDLTFTLVHGLYWLTANLAERGPVMIAVDDAQWADMSSLRFLAYLAARCEELGVLVALTAREDEQTAAADMIAALRSNVRAVRVAPEALSENGVASMVRSALGEHADGSFCSACAHASGGNPFLLHELISELEAERVEPVPASAARVEAVRPGSVAHAAVARLARLGGDATNLARAVAVLETGTLRQAATLADLDQERAAHAADRLVWAQILAPSAQLAFVHPLLRRAVYESILPARRADQHRRAGLLLASEGARSTIAAGHLMRGEPADDPAVVEALRDAARAALADGAPPSAVRLLRRALSEPPQPQLRATVIGELGEAEALARDPAAVGHLEEALAGTSDPTTTARLSIALGALLVWVGRPLDAHQVVVRATERLSDPSQLALRASVETVAVAIASLDRRLIGQVQRRLPELHELALEAGSAGHGLLIFEGCWRSQVGPYDGDWRELVDRGLDGGRYVAEHTATAPVVSYASAVLVLADEVQRAETLIADIRGDARARGSIDAHLTALMWGALLALRRGDLVQGEADARESLEIATRYEVLWTRIWSAAILAGALIDRGELDEADRVLGSISTDAAFGSAAVLHALFARARLRVAQGRRAEATDDLRAAERSVLTNNPSYVPWRSTLALVMARDEPERARELADAELERARELGQPRGIGVALRATAILEGGDAGIQMLKEAVAALRVSPARLELARALCDLGGAQRRAGNRAVAREPLREALELAQRCGAEPLSQRAREELMSTGAHPRRERLSGPDSLTPSERRVAEMAAAGMTNRAIAESLFVTAKTVGTHLGHIYRKLDLDGPQARDRLADRLG